MNRPLETFAGEISVGETLAGWSLAAARRVFVRDLRLDASIGVHAHELAARQPVVVSIALLVGPGEGAERILFAPPLRPNDPAARDVVCYESLSKQVAAILEDGHIGYVETVAERIAALCLGDDRVLEVSVRVEKPDAIPGAAAAGVEILRRR